MFLRAIQKYANLNKKKKKTLEQVIKTLFSELIKIRFILQPLNGTKMHFSSLTN